MTAPSQTETRVGDRVRLCWNSFVGTYLPQASLLRKARISEIHDTVCEVSPDGRRIRLQGAHSWLTSWVRVRN